MAYPRRALVAVALAWLLPALTSFSARANLPVVERQLHFTVFSPRPAARLAFRRDPKATLTEIVLYPSTRSPEYVASVATTLELFDLSTGDKVAEATVPTSVRAPLLLLVPSARLGPETLRYSVAILDDAWTQQPAGTAVVVNFSGVPLSGSAGGVKLQVGEGVSSPFAIRRLTPVHLSTHGPGRRYSVEQDLQLEPGERALILLFPPYYSGSSVLQIRILRDAQPEVPEVRERRKD